MNNDNKKKISFPFFYVLLFPLAVGFGRFHFWLQFAIKPFILLTAVGIIVSVVVFKSMYKLYDFEKWMLLFFLIYMICSVRFYNLNGGIRYICGSILIIAFYFCARIALEQVNIQQLETAISYSGLIIAGISLCTYLYGLYLVQFDFSDIERMRSGGILIELGIPRLYGIIDKDPNIAALGFMLYLIYYVTHLRGVRNYIGLILSGSCMILTFSRSALIALALAWIIGRICPYYERKPIRFRRIYLLIPLAVFIILIFLRWGVGIDWISLIKSRLLLLLHDKGTGRFVLWKYGFIGWLESPLFGIGGNYTKTFIMQFWYKEQVLHNSWLEILLETGIVGAIPYLCFLVKAWDSCCKLSGSKGEWLHFLFAAMIIMMSSLSQQFCPSFYLVIAIIYKYIVEENEKEHGKED